MKNEKEPFVITESKEVIKVMSEGLGNHSEGVLIGQNLDNLHVSKHDAID